MKTLYVLIVACLSLQACNSQTETPTGSIALVEPTTIDQAAKAYADDYAMWTTLPVAEYWVDTTIGDDDYAAGTLPGGDDTGTTASIDVVVPTGSLDIE